MQPSLQASVLDRLLDNEPNISHEPVQYRLLSLGQIKDALVKDLENLLNTRRSLLPPLRSYAEIRKSVAMYGLPDFSSKNPASAMVRQQLRQEIEKTIARFEPRLRNVIVHLETPNQGERNLRFRISGLLIVEPEAEPVTFDTYFDVNKGQYLISK